MAETNNIYTMKIDNSIRYVAGRSHSRYVVEEDGIYEEWDELDQHGEKLQSIGRLVMPRQLFIEAYNAYIVDTTTLVTRT